MDREEQLRTTKSILPDRNISFCPCGHDAVKLNKWQMARFLIFTTYKLLSSNMILY